MVYCTQSCCRPEGDEGIQYLKLDHRMQRARKEHKCIGCKTPIQPGERYSLIIGILDGEFDVIKFHNNPDCGYGYIY